MKYCGDKEILALFKSQRDSAFTLLVEKYQKRIYWYIRRMVVLHEDAEDLVQNVFIKAYRGLGSFSHESSLYTWLYRIATNECHDFFKSRKMNDLSDELLQRFENHCELSTEIELSEESIVVRFQKAVLLLPEKQRTVFNLRYYDDLSYEEIAEITDSNVANLKTNYHYATAKIKDYLQNEHITHIE